MKRKAFTLIELLIVVAIIAILAAIAVPNFLEAQVRSKVSRTKADMRSIRVGLESYAVDNNHYPPTRLPYRMTTPIAYLTTIPLSPWNEQLWDPATENVYLYVSTEPEGNWSGPDNYGDNPRNLNEDYYIYTKNKNDMIQDWDEVYSVKWALKSCGPNNFDDRDVSHPDNPLTIKEEACIYDPTNGTVSLGDIVIFNLTNE
jgi:general secretion pathway protein G